MEYRLQMTVSETVHESTLVARVFISARDDDGARQTAEVWHCSIEKPSVRDETDPIAWASNIVALVNVQLCQAWIETLTTGQDNSMSDLFVPQNFLRVAAGRLTAGRP